MVVKFGVCFCDDIVCVVGFIVLDIDGDLCLDICKSSCEMVCDCYSVPVELSFVIFCLEG